MEERKLHYKRLGKTETNINTLVTGNKRLRHGLKKGRRNGNLVTLLVGSTARNEVFQADRDKQRNKTPVDRRKPDQGSPAQQKLLSKRKITKKGFGISKSRDQDFVTEMNRAKELPSPASYNACSSGLSPSGTSFTKGSRMKSLEEMEQMDDTPGPADTQPVEGAFPTSIHQQCSAISDPNGIKGKFASSVSKNFIEQEIYRTKDVPAPGNHQPKFANFEDSMPRGGKFAETNSKSFIELEEYRTKHIPAPGENQPKHGFSTLNKSGGRFNKTTSKNYIEQHTYDRRHLPAPGSSQPAFGKSVISIARRTSVTYNPSSGKIAEAKSKNYIEQAIHDKKHMPGAGEHQPKGGFSTLDKSGGAFNHSKPKNYIEQHVYDKKHIPAPTDNQPKHGKFAHSIARRVSLTNQANAGKFNTARPKNYIEKHVHEKAFMPAPGVEQPKHGFSTLETGGGRMGQSKSKNYIDQHIYDKDFLPGPGESQPKHGNHAHSIASRTDASKRPYAGRMGQSQSKNYIEQHVHDKKDLPAPGAEQPKHGFSTLITSGGGINKAKSKNYMEKHVFDRRHIPAPGACQPKHGKSAHSIARRTSVTNIHAGGGFNKSKCDVRSMRTKSSKENGLGSKNNKKRAQLKSAKDLIKASAKGDGNAQSLIGHARGSFSI
jgi:hypothetical protein